MHIPSGAYVYDRTKDESIIMSFDVQERWRMECLACGSKIMGNKELNSLRIFHSKGDSMEYYRSVSKMFDEHLKVSEHIYNYSLWWLGQTGT